MNGFMHYGYWNWWNWWTFPFFGGMMFFWIILFLVVGILVYQDANRRGMNGLLWFILVVLPMVGWIFLIIYLIVRETAGKDEKSRSLDILKERYARGEITEEEYRRMKKELEES